MCEGKESIEIKHRDKAVNYAVESVVIPVALAVFPSVFTIGYFFVSLLMVCSFRYIILIEPFHHPVFYELMRSCC